MNVFPWLAERRAQLRRYLAGFLLITLVSFAVFIAWPIRAPKPPVDNPRGMYWLLQQYDAPHNSLPSLHTLAFTRRIVRRETPRGFTLICIVWAALILYATLATKEHYAADIVTGIALALLADWWAWRGRGTNRRGLLENAQKQRPNIPARGEIVIGVADGIDLARQVEDVAEQDTAAVVRTERR